MVLVPQELAQAINGDLPQPPAPVGSYSAMDREMSSILKSTNVDDLTKWKQYSNVLERYMAKLERTKNAFTFHEEYAEEEDDGVGDGTDVSAQQPPSPKKAKVSSSKKLRASSQVTPRTKVDPNGSVDPIPPEILKGLVTAKDKSCAQKLYKTLGVLDGVSVTKTGLLKIKRKNIGPWAPLIRYKVKGESGIPPGGWNEFSELLEDLKGTSVTKTVSPPKRTRRATKQLVGNGRSWLAF